MNHRDRSSEPAGWLALAGWIALCLGAGGIGGIASANAGDFYGALARPSWAPPAWLFGPVWTLLYILMGVAAWLVWRVRTGGSAAARKRGLTLFVVQLLLNALWTWLFFHWRLGAWAFAEIVVLWLLVVAAAAAFFRVRKMAGWMLVPYLLWLTYAGALTWAVWRSNPGAL